MPRQDTTSPALLNDTFQIVHISGHGTDDGLILEDEYGKSNVVPPEILADIFAAHSPPVQCVVLNACYSAAQGELIARAVPFTIAVAGLLNDAAAKEFSRGFYDAMARANLTTSPMEKGVVQRIWSLRRLIP